MYRRIGYKQVAESAQVVFMYEDSSYKANGHC